MPVVWTGTSRNATKKACQDAVQAILGSYRRGEVVDQEDDDLLLRDLLNMHPDAPEKVGPGVDHFCIIATPRGNHKGPICLMVTGSVSAPPDLRPALVGGSGFPVGRGPAVDDPDGFEPVLGAGFP